MIEIKDLSFRYPQQTEYALKNVSLEIQAGEWVAIIGHNGSGKSTLAKVIDGLELPETGEIKINGQVLNPKTVWDIRKEIGMVFQNPDNQFVGADVAGDVAFGLENQAIPRDEMIERVQRALEAVDMAEFSDHEPGKLSGGQKQRVAIAGVLAVAPRIVIFDESTSMLDPQGRRDIIALIREMKEKRGFTVLSITHDIDEAALADRIVVVKKGEIKKVGTPATVFTYGDKLIELGLDIPYQERLKAEMKKQGYDVPQDYLSTEGMVEWLCQSILND